MIALALATVVLLPPQEWQRHLGKPDGTLRAYLAGETVRVAKSSDIRREKKESWIASRSENRRRFREMLGLDPLPERTDLRVEVTGTLRDDALGITVEKLHFQSMPRLYVTANLYRPTKIDNGTKLPAILYLCGHGRVKIDGVSYGNKTNYQHHPAWFAQNGFVCLVIDTLQLGEIEGVHHGTYRLKQWWWVRRGYTPAGVEAWNSTRAIDLLCARPEVDPKRIGVTGRSGGGVGTWYLAAIDDRPAVLAPVAGLTDMRNHVVDGCIEGHCDCNYFLNYYQWDWDRIAALAAPRPLLFSNSDNDRIFPLDGVLRLYARLRHVYGLYDARGALGLSITPGPHRDTPELRVPVFRWMMRHLKGENDAIVQPARKHFDVKQLKVLDGFPRRARNRNIQGTFVALAAAKPEPRGRRPHDALIEWRERVLLRLKRSTFRTARDPSRARLALVDRGEVRGVYRRRFVLDTGDVFKLPFVLYTKTEKTKPRRVVLQVATDLPRDPPVTVDERTACAVVVPRGMGPTRWSGDARKRNHVRRRFLVLGRTLAQTRIFDVRAAVHALRTHSVTRQKPVVLQGSGETAEIAMFATILDPSIASLELRHLPKNLGNRIELLGVNRLVRDEDIPELVGPRRVRFH